MTDAENEENAGVASGFQFDGKRYEMGNLMLAEARAIQRTTGLKPPEFEAALNAWDAEAITALVWIGRKRFGEPNLRFEDVDGDLSTFRPYLVSDEEVEALMNDGASLGKSESDSASASPDEPPGLAGTSAAEA